MADEIHAYPLCWPIGWNRTLPHLRLRAQFGRHERRQIGDYGYTSRRDLTVSEGVRRVLTELRRLGVREGDAIISTNVRVRLDGLPRSDGRKPDDPGVAVYWRRDGEPQRCMAIDRYDDVADNLAAIAATLEAMRAIERHGGAVVLDRAFTGFAALPAPSDGTRDRRTWREVLGFPPVGPVMAEALRDRYRALRSKHHPDRGGDAGEFSAVQRAYEEGASAIGVRA